MNEAKLLARLICLSDIEHESSTTSRMSALGVRLWRKVSVCRPVVSALPCRPSRYESDCPLCTTSRLSAPVSEPTSSGRYLSCTCSGAAPGESVSPPVGIEGAETRKNSGQGLVPGQPGAPGCSP